MALEQRHVELDLLHVLGHQALGRNDGPVDQGLDVLALDLRQDARQVRLLLAVDLGDDHGDAVLGGQGIELFLAGGAVAVVARDDADLRDAQGLHGLEDAAYGVAVLLGRLEDVRGHRVDDVLGRRARQKDRLALLADVLDSHGLAAGRGADDGQDLVLVDELLGHGDGVFGLAAGILDDELDLVPQDAAGLVDALHEHLGRFGLGPAQVRGGAGHGKDGAHLDGRLLGGRRRGARQANRQTHCRRNEHLRQLLIHEKSPFRVSTVKGSG